jgi:hypothetical protein
MENKIQTSRIKLALAQPGHRQSSCPDSIYPETLLLKLISLNAELTFA